LINTFDKSKFTKQKFGPFRQIVKLSKLEVPNEIRQIVEPLSGNDDAIRNYGIHQCVELIRYTKSIVLDIFQPKSARYPVLLA
jgi:Methylenetetrahydrofolate reductase